MGIFGWIEDSVREADCLIFGHDYGPNDTRSTCANCGRKQK